MVFTPLEKRWIVIVIGMITIGTLVIVLATLSSPESTIIYLMVDVLSTVLLSITAIGDEK